MSTEVICRKSEPRAAPKLLPIKVSRRAYAILFVSLAAGLCALPSFVSGYAMTLAVEIMIAGIFASGINLLTGYTGLVSLGQAMFLGLGGYGIAIGTALLGWPLWVSAPVTLVVVAAIAAGIGAICTRTRGVEFLLITLAFSQMFYGAAIKLRWTNGSDGMTGIPRPDLSLLGVSADSPVTFYYYVLAVSVLALLLLSRIVNSPFGSILVGIRETNAA
jgi:branched-chain amino acid transport system permease protein